jgi:replicative DNA helicase
MMNVVKKAESFGLDTELEGSALGYFAKLASLPKNNAGYYAQKIKEQHAKHRLKEAADQISIMVDSDKPLEDILQEAGKVIVSSVESPDQENADIKRVIDEYDHVQLEHHERFLNGGGLIGLTSGFDWLDQAIDGIRPGHLWVIGGYSSAGKTFFSLNIAKALIEKKKRVLYFSLEMSKVDIVSRLLGIITELNGRTILKQPLPSHDTDRVECAKQLLIDSNMALYSGMHDHNRVLLTTMQENLRAHVDCVFIDYLQLFRTGGKSEYEAMTNIITELQNFSQRTGIPIIVLSQVSNEHAKNTSPTMGFKGSGAIGASAELALEIRVDMDLETDKSLADKISKDEPYTVKIIAKKNRQGKMGSFRCLFWGKVGKFIEVKADPSQPSLPSLTEPEQIKAKW